MIKEASMFSNFSWTDYAESLIDETLLLEQTILQAWGKSVGTSFQILFLVRSGRS